MMRAAAIDSTPSEAVASRRRVQVWLGEHVIAETLSEPAYAARYEAAMRSMWPGLRITSTAIRGGEQ